MNIGILRETKSPAENRVPFTPKQCRQIGKEHPELKIFVQPSNSRCFTDKEYEQEGIVLMNDLSGCDVLMGVKEVKPQDLMPGKMYFFFSHTIKKQKHNKALLKTILEKNIHLVDYETLTYYEGARIVGFGRWAGLVGAYNGVRALCIRYHIPRLLPPQECRDLKEMIGQASGCKLSPVRIAITGDGRVANGAEEMLLTFGVDKVGVEEYLNNPNPGKPVYVKLGPENYNRNKSGARFDLHHFFNSPDAYESHFGRFCDRTDLLIMAAYWDPKAPVLFTPDRMRDKDFSIKLIADITCDINGSVPSSIRTTSFSDPYYDYNPATGKEEAAFSHPDNITVMTIDNLPCGLPVEASLDFGNGFMKYVLPLLINGDPDNILARATIANHGKLAERYSYLADWVKNEV